MSVKVLIPHYKNKKQLEACEKALKGQVSSENITMVDDSDTSHGFVWAANELIRPLVGTDIKYGILLNQDCYLKKGAIEAMVKFMDEHPKCAIGGPKHFGPDDDDFITHGGCTVAFPQGRHIGGYKSKGECAKNKRMPWINGACMIFRVEAIVDIGLMDSNYKMICSDSDWCYTARSRGWEVWYIADAECIHDHGISAGSNNPEINKLKLMDTLMFRDKWLTGGFYREMSLEIFDD